MVTPGGLNFCMIVRSHRFFKTLNAIEIRKDSSEMTEMRSPSAPLLLSPLVALLVALLWATWNNNTRPIVKLHYGSFQGKVDGGLIQYLGIPFAAPPYAMFLCCVSVTF